MTLIGTQIIPSDIQFKDGVSGQWSQLETPNSVNRRLQFDIPAGKTYTTYNFVNGILTSHGPYPGPSSIEPNQSRDVNGGWPAIYVYSQP